MPRVISKLENYRVSTVGMSAEQILSTFDPEKYKQTYFEDSVAVVHQVIGESAFYTGFIITRLTSYKCPFSKGDVLMPDDNFPNRKLVFSHMELLPLEDLKKPEYWEVREEADFINIVGFYKCWFDLESA